MNRLIKSIFLITIIMMFFFCTTVNAATDLTTMTTQAQKFISHGESNASGIEYTKITEEFTGLGKILTTIGAGVMVGVITYMGIKYLTSGPEAQAKLKTQLIGVVVSGFVIFGSYTIWKIVVTVAEKF